MTCILSVKNTEQTLSHLKKKLFITFISLGWFASEHNVEMTCILSVKNTEQTLSHLKKKLFLLYLFHLVGLRVSNMRYFLKASLKCIRVLKVV